MKINNKEFGEWTADDLQVLLNNDAYRENNFIDYKVNFAPLVDKCSRGKNKLSSEMMSVPLRMQTEDTFFTESEKVLEQPAY